jgi:zinc protease
MGFLKDIIDMPNQYAYSLKFFDRFYRPEYCTILVVGDVTPEQVLKFSEKYFGNWKRGNYSADIPVEPPQNGIRYTHIKNSEVPPVLSLNFKGPAFSDTDIDNPAFDIIRSVYFSGVSDLYKKLVIEERKVRYVNLNPPFSRDPNLITISASVKNKEDMQYVKDEIMKTLEKAKTLSVDESKLKDAISNLKYSFAMGNDTPGAIAGILAYYIAVGENPECVNNYYNLYDKVNANDLTKIAQKYFVESGLTIGTISADDSCPVK